MYSLVRTVSYPRSQVFIPHAALRYSTAGFDAYLYSRSCPHKAGRASRPPPRLPPAPELRRTQDTANTSLIEHIYLYMFGCLAHFSLCPQSCCVAPSGSYHANHRAASRFAHAAL